MKLNKGNATLIRDFVKACFQGRIDFVKSALKQGFDPNSLHETIGSRPLTAAASKGYLELVKLLIKNGAEINLQDTWKTLPPGRTPLEIACRNGHIEVVNYLLAHGADVNKVGYWSPIKTAASHGHGEIIRTLLKAGAKYEESDLSLAARSGSLDAVTQLIQAGADAGYQDTDGESPLHAAAKRESPEIVQLLLENGAKLDMQTKRSKETALHFAAWKGRLEIAKVLVKAGADLSLQNFKRRTAEQWAREYGNSEVANFLREAAKLTKSPSAAKTSRKSVASRK